MFQFKSEKYPKVQEARAGCLPMPQLLPVCPPACVIPPAHWALGEAGNLSRVYPVARAVTGNPTAQKEIQWVKKMDKSLGREWWFQYSMLDLDSSH